MPMPRKEPSIIYWKIKVSNANQYSRTREDCFWLVNCVSNKNIVVSETEKRDTTVTWMFSLSDFTETMKCSFFRFFRILNNFVNDLSTVSCEFRECAHRVYVCFIQIIKIRYFFIFIKTFVDTYCIMTY